MLMLPRYSMRSTCSRRTVAIGYVPMLRGPLRSETSIVQSSRSGGGSSTMPGDGSRLRSNSSSSGSDGGGRSNSIPSRAAIHADTAQESDNGNYGSSARAGLHHPPPISPAVALLPTTEISSVMKPQPTLATIAEAGLARGQRPAGVIFASACAGGALLSFGGAMFVLVGGGSSAALAGTVPGALCTAHITFATANSRCL
jgi:hypothetical protein